jgi:hypothetical protein
MAQALLTGLIVSCCAAYVLWVLMPAATRQRIVQVLLRRRMPDFVSRHLQARLKAAPGCHCDGCEHGAAAPGAEQPVHWAARRRD